MRRRRTRLAIGVAALVTLSTAVSVWLGGQAESSTAVKRDADQGAAPTPATTAAPASSTTTSPAASSPADPPEQWVTSQVTMTYDGLDRYYLITRPSRPTSRPLPLVIALHGRDAPPSAEEARMDFASVAGPAVLVYPAGQDLSWNAGACCGGANAAGVDDVGFLTAVVHAVLSTLPPSSAHLVYLAGYSNGGKMAYRLACADPGLFRAVAVYGATPVASCPSPPATSFLDMASTGDPELTIGPGGASQQVDGFVEPTVTAEVGRYRAADDCTSTATSSAGDLATTTWACPGGRAVSMALYRGGSHAWPAGTASTPSGQEVMWRFFVTAGASQ